MIEQMFGHADSVIGLWPGERPDDLPADDVLAYELTCRLLADGWVDDDQHVLPSGFDDLVPGLHLAAVVSTIDASKLNGYDSVRLMKARARLAAHHDAGKYAAMAEVAFSPPGDADAGVFRLSDQVDYAEVEIAAALSLTRATSRKELSRAVSLSEGLVRVRDRFSVGDIDVFKMRVLENALCHLPPQVVDPILDRILPDASELTTGQLRARVTRLVLEFDPSGGESSFKEGLEDRGVAVYPNPDLTGTLAIHNSDPTQIAAARAHIEELARSLKTPCEPRTLDQLRADVALDLLAGKCDHQSGTKTGRVSLVVSLDTLAGLSDAPGDLEGYGPVIAEIARKVATETDNMTYTVTDNGEPLSTGTISRRPTAAQRRHLEAVYPTCVMVGCRQPAWECDLDHRKPRAEGGATHTDNLEPLCRHHHMVRHHTQWQVERLPNGDHQWTSPLGHVYIKRRGPPD